MSRLGQPSVWIGVLLLMLCGCVSRSAQRVQAPPGIWVVTDSTRYHIRFVPGDELHPSQYYLTMQAMYFNRSDERRYLYRSCGTWDTPSRRFIRVGDDPTPVELTAIIGCDWSGQLQPPIPVDPGSSYVDRFVLRSSENPSITPDQRQGTFRLVYAVQRTPTAGWDPVDLVPESERTSNPFEVVLPRRH